MRKVILCIIHLTMIFALFGSIQDIEAIQFENQEQKYMSLCSSSQLSKYQSECKEFNEYLKKKNKNLKQTIVNTQNDIEKTKNDIDSVQLQISSLDQQIKESEKEIAYIESSIHQLQQSIVDKENELKDRMYVMQSHINSNRYIEYLFSSDSFTEFFSRTESVNELTRYDNELIDQLTAEKKMIEDQKTILMEVKENVELQKQQQVTLQNQYNELLKAQSETLNKVKKEQAEVKESQGKLDMALSALVDQTQTSSSGVSGDSKLGQAIANKALSKQGCMYLWGAGHTMSEIKNPNTSRFDCSGLVSWAYYQAGCNIGVNTTKSLLNKGIAITAHQLQAGDIILFKNSSGVVSHVGIAINNSQMVHAPETGKAVQVANLTQGWRSRVISYRRLY